ncbi:MAG: N-acetylmuramoyl-L-alanine amidase [Kiritimatiellae bacterium]|nr:N-acetylmuramoyl-L-alanine amidase [Kiritimatiellia bacterium]
MSSTDLHRRTFIAWLTRSGFLTAVGFALPARAAASSTHFTLQELAARYGFRITRLSEKSSILSGRAGSLSFVHKSHQSQVNSTAVWLCSPVVSYRGSWGVHRTDVERVIDPILRPRNFLKTVGSRVIVLDAGHGDGDVGAIGKKFKLREKDLTLDLAKRVRSKLVNRGYRTLLTRDNDRLLALDARPARAKSLKADIFVSLHFNAGNASASGIETFALTPRNHASTGSRSVSKTYYSGHQYDAANHFLGYCVQRRTRQAVDATDRGVRHARFAVLRSAPCPAVLMECGFLSHAATEAQLRSSAYRDRLAQGISDGIVDYLREAAAARGAK